LSVNINGTTAETVVAGADEILIYDASATALRKMTRTNFVLSEAEVDAMVSNNGFLSAEADTLASVTGRGATTATSITLNTQAQARFADSAGGEYAAIQAPATIGTNYVLTLPDTAGTNGQVLSTNGSGVLSWIAIPSAPVTTVFGRSGAVVAAASDYDANQIDNTPAGSISATEVQAAINELDAEKVAKAGDAMTGALTMNAQNQVRFADTAGGEYAAIQAPATIGTNYVLTLPDTAGSASQVLTTNGSGVLSWTTPSHSSS
jgi:trimeric autotransporter adhesin